MVVIITNRLGSGRGKHPPGIHQGTIVADRIPQSPETPIHGDTERERAFTRPNSLCLFVSVTVQFVYSTRSHMLSHERPVAVSPARGVVLTDLQSSI